MARRGAARFGRASLGAAIFLNERQRMNQMKAKIVGTSHLKMHNERLANPLDEVTKRLKAITSKKKKTDDDYVAMMEIEFEGGLYFDEKIGPYLPSKNIKAMIGEGARKTRGGVNVSESLQILEAKTPLIYKGPRDVAGMWKAKLYDVSGVGVGPKRIMRTRPMFFPWSAEFTICYDISVINRESLIEYLTTAGARTGFMDHRPEFGKFELHVLEG